MKTDDELISEFMGYRYETINGPLIGEKYVQVKITSNSNWQITQFSRSWDWLMPVVNKISQLYLAGEHDWRWNKSINKLRSYILYAKIDHVNQAVTEFIKCYNTTLQRSN